MVYTRVAAGVVNTSSADLPRLRGAPGRMAAAVETFDVLILGAGAAGLGTARRLADTGGPLRVAVLEARDRLGGRTQTVTATTGAGIDDGVGRQAGVPAGGHVVELGAEFIHGETVSTWALLSRYGLTANDGGNARACFVERGGRVEPATGEMAAALNTAVWGLGEPAGRWAAAQPAGTDPDAVDAEAAGLLPGPGRALTAEDAQLLRNAAAEMIGADLDDVSMAAFLGRAPPPDVEQAQTPEREEGSGPAEKTQFRLDSGYTELWRRLAADLDVRLGVAVTSLQRQRDGTVRVTTAPAAAVDGSGARLVETVYAARRVVVTAPLAVLQRRAIGFEPALPAPKQAAIDGLGAGQCAKVVLTFKEAFWPREMSFLFTARPSQILWQPAEGHSGAAAAASTTITAFFAGRDCKRLVAAGEAAAVASVLADLEAMFRRPGLRNELVHGHFQNWSADPWAGMAYSYSPPGSVGMRAELGRAEWAGALCFAGEATSETSHGLVNGALDTGYRAAEEVLAGLGVAVGAEAEAAVGSARQRL
jgi:monoamine oxidase